MQSLSMSDFYLLPVLTVIKKDQLCCLYESLLKPLGHLRGEMVDLRILCLTHKNIHGCVNPALDKDSH